MGTGFIAVFYGIPLTKCTPATACDSAAKVAVVIFTAGLYYRRRSSVYMTFVQPYSLICYTAGVRAIAAAQCIVIGPVCLFVGVSVTELGQISYFSN